MANQLMGDESDRKPITANRHNDKRNDKWKWSGGNDGGVMVTVKAVVTGTNNN